MLAPGTDGGAPISVAVDERVDIGRAPWPANVSERLVFAQVYETLVRVDCERSVVPGLAQSWREVPDERAWVFTLRRDARFHDGSPITARSVAEGWLVPAADRRVGPVTRAGTVAMRSAREAVGSVTVLDEHTLRVDLAESWRDVGTTGPALFASPELAVHKSSGAGLPLGSGAYELTASSPAMTHGRAAVELRPAFADRSGQTPGPGGARLPLTFHLLPGEDPRNSLDAGVDVLLAADAEVVDYARGHGAYVIAPLPWDVAYVLVTPVRPEDAAAPTRAPAEALAELARDAVPGDARASSLESAWTCAGERPAGGGARPRPRVVFSRGDRGAAGIAERLVALARAGESAPGWILDAFRATASGAPPQAPGALVATPHSPDELVASMRRGADVAYVLPIALSEPAWCPPAGRATLAAVPLVDTRGAAILRRGIEGITVDGRGVLDFAGASRRADAEARR